VAVAVARLQLVILHVRAKPVVQEVEQLETMEAVQVLLLDWELRVKVLTVDHLQY
jgi:hypothetical protein